MSIVLPITSDSVATIESSVALQLQEPLSQEPASQKAASQEPAPQQEPVSSLSQDPASQEPSSQQEPAPQREPVSSPSQEPVLQQSTSHASVSQKPASQEQEPTEADTTDAAQSTNYATTTVHRRLSKRLHSITLKHQRQLTSKHRLSSLRPHRVSTRLVSKPPSKKANQLKQKHVRFAPKPKSEPVQQQETINTVSYHRKSYTGIIVQCLQQHQRWVSKDNIQAYFRENYFVPQNVPFRKAIKQLRDQGILSSNPTRISLTKRFKAHPTMLTNRHQSYTDLIIECMLQHRGCVSTNTIRAHVLANKTRTQNAAFRKAIKKLCVQGILKTTGPWVYLSPSTRRQARSSQQPTIQLQATTTETRARKQKQKQEQEQEASSSDVSDSDTDSDYLNSDSDAASLSDLESDVNESIAMSIDNDEKEADADDDLSCDDLSCPPSPPTMEPAETTQPRTPVKSKSKSIKAFSTPKPAFLTRSAMIDRVVTRRMVHTSPRYRILLR